MTWDGPSLCFFIQNRLYLLISYENLYTFASLFFLGGIGLNISIYILLLGIYMARRVMTIVVSDEDAAFLTKEKEETGKNKSLIIREALGQYRIKKG